MPTPEVAFGQVLRALREKSGLSQEKLAFEGGLDRTFISLLERGLRQPSLKTLLQLAAVLKIRASEMVHLVEQQLAPKGRKS